MGQIHVAVDIDAPIAEVWKVIESIEHHVDWMLDAETIAFEGPQRRGVGTRFVCRTKVGPMTLDDHMEITEWQPERSIGVRHSGVVKGTGVFELEAIDLDRRTRVTWTERLKFPWFLAGRLGEWAGGHVVLRLIWQRNLRSLARLVESPPD
jgi:carbon monoxide dehydrogenase subunit G